MSTETVLFKNLLCSRCFYSTSWKKRLAQETLPDFLKAVIDIKSEKVG
jgi:hypothetical protein